MSKRKIMLAAMSVCMIAILAIGGSLAYLTDTDNETNTFTVGKLDIAIDEKYTQDSKLVPVTYDEEGKRKDDNVVTKEVYVENLTGSETGYVRVHIAIPSDLVDQNINAYNDILHVNFTKESVQASEWCWMQTNTIASETYPGWDGNGRAKNNTYNIDYAAEKDGTAINYTVFVVTYRTALAAGQKTATPAISSLYIDADVEATTANGVVSYTRKTEDNPPATMTADMSLCNKIVVMAEGVQEAGFADAYTALNTAFGVPSATNNPFTGYAE